MTVYIYLYAIKIISGKCKKTEHLGEKNWLKTKHGK